MTEAKKTTTTLGGKEHIFFVRKWVQHGVSQRNVTRIVGKHYDNGGALVLAKHPQPGTMDNKIWLSMHSRNFNCDKIFRPCVRPFILAHVKCHTH